VVIFTTRQKELQAKADHSLPLQKIENQM
jgi:hypothetical protein